MGIARGADTPSLCTSDSVSTSKSLDACVCENSMSILEMAMHLWMLPSRSSDVDEFDLVV